MNETQNEKAVPTAPQLPPVVHNTAAVMIIPRSQSEEYKSVLSAAQSGKGLMATLFSLAFGFLFVDTIFLGSLGASVPIATLLYSGCILAYFYESDRKLNTSGVALTVPILVMSAGFVLHYNPSTHFITVLTMLALLAAQLILLSGCNVKSIFSLDMVAKIFSQLIGRSLSFLDMPFRSLAGVKRIKSKAVTTGIKVAGGLVLSLPFAAILLLLFSQADSVFKKSLDAIINALNISVGKLIADIILGGIGAIFLAAILISAKGGETDVKEKNVMRFLDTTVSITFLTIVNLILISFVIVQFGYLFAGAAGTLQNGLTYAEYARRGFFELAAASGLCFALAIFVLAFCRATKEKPPVAIRVLIALMCTCNGVILASAVKRMMLYVEVYGLSIRRVLTLWFMAVVGICLVWLVLKCIVTNFNAPRFIGITVVVGVCVLSLFNADKSIAGYNIERYLQNPAEAQIDTVYFFELSYSAMPEAVELERSLTQSDNIMAKENLHDAIEAMKAEFNHRHRIYGFTFEDFALQQYMR